MTGRSAAPALAEDGDAVAQQPVAECCAETGWTPDRIELIAA